MSVARVYTAIAIVVFNSALFLLIAELGARAYIRVFATERATPSELMASRTLRYSPHPYLTYYPTPLYEKGGTKHNSLGYRGREFARNKAPGAFRIVTLGGSTTYTESVEDNELTYPRVMEKVLIEQGYDQIEVVNAGIGGHSSFESLVNFQFRVLDLEPDLIIVYHGANDIHTRFVPPDLHRGDNTGRRKSWAEPGAEEELWQRSALLRLYKEYVYDVPRSPNDYTGTKTSWYFTGDQVAVLRENTNQYVRRNISNIVAVARQHGIEVVLATFAHTKAYEKHYAVWEGYQLGFRQSNEMIREIARENGVHMFDFATEMPVEKAYWSDGIHLNEKGAALKGRLFADYLRARVLEH